MKCERTQHDHGTEAGSFGRRDWDHQVTDGSVFVSEEKFWKEMQRGGLCFEGASPPLLV